MNCHLCMYCNKSIQIYWNTKKIDFLLILKNKNTLNDQKLCFIYLKIKKKNISIILEISRLLINLTLSIETSHHQLKKAVQIEVQICSINGNIFLGITLNYIGSDDWAWKNESATMVETRIFDIFRKKSFSWTKTKGTECEIVSTKLY